MDINQNEKTMAISSEPTKDADGWREIPEYRLELVRDRSIKFRQFNTGKFAKMPQKDDVVAFLHTLLDKEPVENFVVLFLDLTNKLVGAQRLSIGTVDHVETDMRSIFRSAIVAGADRIIIAHNHVIGEVRASRQDIMLTATAVEIGQLLGIDVVDSIIVGPDGSYYSLWEHRIDFENEMTAILKEKMGAVDLISGLLEKITGHMPSPEESGSLGTMNVGEVQKKAASTVAGNPFLKALNLGGRGKKNDPNQN